MPLRGTVVMAWCPAGTRLEHGRPNGAVEAVASASRLAPWLEVAYVAAR